VCSPLHSHPAPPRPARRPPRQSLAQALRLGLDDGALLERVGAGWLALGDWERAEEVLRRAVSAGASVKAERMLADALAERGQVSEAIALYERVRAHEPLLESEARHVHARLGALNELAGRK
jgi:uncharacterized protein HemY